MVGVIIGWRAVRGRLWKGDIRVRFWIARIAADGVHLPPFAVAALLTGMGADGALGLLRILEAGGRTMAQDKETSVVWGMPGEAVKLGAAEEVLPLGSIAQRLVQLASRQPETR